MVYGKYFEGPSPTAWADPYYKAEKLALEKREQARAEKATESSLAESLHRAEQDRITNARNAEKDRRDRLDSYLKSDEAADEQFSKAASGIPFPEYNDTDTPEVRKIKEQQYMQGTYGLIDIYGESIYKNALDAGYSDEEAKELTINAQKRKLTQFQDPEQAKKILIAGGYLPEDEEASSDMSDERRYAQNEVDIARLESIQNPTAKQKQELRDKSAFNEGVRTRRRAGATEIRSTIGAKADEASAIKAAQLEQQLAFEPRIERAKAIEKIAGETVGEARKNLPKRIDDANYMVGLIDEVINHPGMKQAVGKSRYALIQKVYGTDAYDFQTRLDQVNGQTFMEAYETLKGGGQITEIEGEKATAARHRMNAAGSEKEFVKAAREYQEIIKKGLDRYKKLADLGVKPAPPQAVNYLREHPETKAQFKEQFGYIPEGM